VSIISLTGIEKFYGDYHALRGIDLEIEQGEFFSLLGPFTATAPPMRSLAGSGSGWRSPARWC